MHILTTVLVTLLLMCTPTHALEGIHKKLLARHVYVSDVEQYGVQDRWEMSLTGDCEDFAVFSYFYLIGKGYTPEFWLVRTEVGELHVALLVEGKIFDNRMIDDVNAVHYTFVVQMDINAIRKAIKRQNKETQ